MTRVKDLGKKTYQFYCEGCKMTHNVNCNPDGFGPFVLSGTKNNPTFNHNLLIRWKNQDGSLHTCHSKIIGGQIEFLNDSTHNLRGRKIPLIEKF